MAFSDKDFISTEKHELDYVLRKWSKRTTQENRDKLVEALDAFNADASLEPHLREQFYEYAERTGLLARLAAKEGEESATFAPASAKAAVPDTAPSAKKKFPWWWILIAIVVIVLAIILLRSCGGCSAASPAQSAAAVPAPSATAQPAAAAAAPAPKRLTLEALPQASLAIRFLPNSTTMLAAGEEAKLAALIAAFKAFDEGELAVVGHAAGIGYPAGEERVSEGRAKYIAKRLSDAGLASGIKVSAEWRGASNMLPGSGEAARAASRRVEILVK